MSLGSRVVKPRHPIQASCRKSQPENKPADTRQNHVSAGMNLICQQAYLLKVKPAAPSYLILNGPAFSFVLTFMFDFHGWKHGAFLLRLHFAPGRTSL